MISHKVLVVDDHPDSAFMLAGLFKKKLACTVTTSFSVDQAEQILKVQKFDLIVSDYEMPERNGSALINVLNHEHIHTPLVFYTGLEQSTYFWKSMDYPCAVIIKPNFQAVLAIAKKFFGISSFLFEF